jgi:hypothetical protein
VVDGGAKLKMVAVPAKITDMLSELIDVCFWGKADMEFSTRRCLHMTRLRHRPDRNPVVQQISLLRSVCAIVTETAPGAPQIQNI